MSGITPMSLAHIMYIRFACSQESDRTNPERPPKAASHGRIVRYPDQAAKPKKNEQKEDKPQTD
jgi:hypothetical protein